VVNKLDGRGRSGVRSGVKGGISETAYLLFVLLTLILSRRKVAQAGALIDGGRTSSGRSYDHV
jgi:hypothetical protein